jgi:hypothetical protein
VIDEISELLPALVALRRDLHAHPELAFAEHRTARIVAAALRELDLEVHEGMGGTGVVGVLSQGSAPRRARAPSWRRATASTSSCASRNERGWIGPAPAA